MDVDVENTPCKTPAGKRARAPSSPTSMVAAHLGKSARRSTSQSTATTQSTTHTPSVPSVPHTPNLAASDIQLYGSSRTTGGVLRGKAQGNAPNMADLCERLCTLVLPGFLLLLYSLGCGA